MSFGRYTVARSMSYTQDTASDAWVIAHNLNGSPIVDVQVHDPDMGNQLSKIIPAGVDVIDANTVLITFSSPQTGVATLTS